MQSLAVVVLSVCAFAVNAQWERMPGQAIQISAKGDEVWAITKYYKPMRLVDGSWKYTGKFYRGTHIAAIPDGLAYLVNRLDDDPNVKLRVFDPKTETFEPVKSTGGPGGFKRAKPQARDFVGGNRPSWGPFPDGGQAWGTGLSSSSSSMSSSSMKEVIALTNVNAAAQDKIVGVATNGCIWRSANNGAWALLDERDPRCDNLQVAIGERNETWRVDLSGNLHRYNLGAWVKQEQPKGGQGGQQQGGQQQGGQQQGGQQQGGQQQGGQQQGGQQQGGQQQGGQQQGGQQQGGQQQGGQAQGGAAQGQDKPLVYIDVQDRQRAVAVDTEQKAHIWDGKAWKEITGDAKCVQATVSYDKAYCVDASGTIWRAAV